MIPWGMERFEKPLRAFLIAFLVGVAGFLLYTGRINWGKIEIAPASTITVTGTSKMDQAPQVANYNATVTVSDDDKTVATNSVNTKMTEIISSLKSFGIAEADIQTAQVSVYENAGQPEILIYPPRPTTPAKKWQASNSITIKLRDSGKASGLTDLLNGSGATSVSGPNFTIEDTKSSDSTLLADAIADAKANAEAMAKAGGRVLGKMITVTEGYSVQPLYSGVAMEKVDTSARGIPSPIEPGTQTLMKTVTVIFELR